jgi:VCBS repeat-containing protein
MTNHNPSISSSNATGSFSENANTTGSNALHDLSGTMNFTDSDRSDTHTVSASLKSKTLSNGSVIPAATLAHINSAMSTSILNDSNGSGKLKWAFSAEDDDFDFLSKNQTLTLTYEVKLNDNHGGSITKLVTVTVTGTDDKAIIDFGTEVMVSEQANKTLSFSPDAVNVAVHFTDVDLTNTGHTATVVDVSASGATGGILPGAFGEAVLMSFFDINSVVKASGSSSGVINARFSAPDLAFDYLSAGETVDITYTIRLDDHAGGISLQTVVVTVVGSNDKPFYLCGPECAQLTENQNVSPDGNLTAQNTLLFTDIDLSDTHDVSTTVTATLSGGGTIPLTNADLIAAFHASVQDSTGHLLGKVDWNFAIDNDAIGFLDEGETLTLTYTVKIDDGAGGFDTQTVTIKIDGKDGLVVNPVSVAAHDTASPDAGSLYEGNVITDAGDNGDGPLSVTDVNGQASNVAQVVSGTYGDLVIKSDGSYLYVVNSSVDALQAGDHPTDQFTFTVSDGGGHNKSTTLTFNISGANDPPTITAAEATGSVIEDAGPAVTVNGGFESGDLSGWTIVGTAQAQFRADGGEFGDYAAQLSGSGSIAQDVMTTPGEHYTVSFFVTGDPESTTNSLTVTWNGATILALSDSQSGGFTRYSFDVVGNASQSFTSLQFSYTDDGISLYLDQVAVNPANGPATETADGSVSFSDFESVDTHTASFVAQSSGYFGTFSLDPVSESSGSGTVAWHFTVDNADIQFLGSNDILTQTYKVLVTDDHGASVGQDVTITLIGTNDAPTTVGDDSIITNAGVNGGIFIPDWVLTRNDVDPDTSDTLSVSSTSNEVGGDAFFFGGLLWFDDATPGGSFDYNTTDGAAVSSGSGTVTLVNNPVSTTTLTGTSGDDILIARVDGTKLDGGGGDDILIGNAGAHVLTGGSGDDVFAFQVVPDGPNSITDFNNGTDHDRIAISASAFGGGLTVGMDVATVFESSAHADFQSNTSLFHYDTSSDTLYYSADGTTASAIMVTHFQSGVVLNAHDVMIV